MKSFTHLSFVLFALVGACGDSTTTGNSTQCSSGNCSQDCTSEGTDVACELQCGAGTTCDGTCNAGQTCNFQCTGDAQCTFRCGASPASCVVQGGASCTASGMFTGICGGNIQADVGVAPDSSGAAPDAGSACADACPEGPGYDACIAACG